MTCCQRQSERKVKHFRSSSVHPTPTKKKHTYAPPSFSINEKMKCGGCNEFFDLGSNELKIHCNLCNQFFHCRIAGKCDGDGCRIKTRDGRFHRASYCYDCIGLLSDKKILCKDCFMDEHLKKSL
jgi:hypothetical protein